VAKKVFVSFVLDETGSMSVCKTETISGYNEYIKTLADEHKNVRFTLTQFNASKLEIVHDAVKIKNVPELTAETYKPDNLTPLYDAIAATIKSTEKRAKDSPVLFVVMTDGEENASREHDFKSVQALIAEKDSWTFVYLGANQDAWEIGTKMGYVASNIMNYSAARTGQTMTAVAAASSHWAGAAAAGAHETDNFWKDVDKDDLI